MRLWISFLVTWLASATAEDKKVVCYYGSWAVYRPGNGKFGIPDINPTLCTHIIYSFAGITEDGNIRSLDPYNDLPDNGGKDGFRKFNKLRELSPSTKTLLAIGGWNEGSTTFSTVMNQSSLRSNFVRNAVNFVLKYGFNGLDLDWEYPNQRGGIPADKQNFVLLLKELQLAFKEHGLLLSSAVAASESSASQSYDIPQISKYLDFINLMAYDFHGSWETVTGFNAPLYPASRETGDLARSLNVNSTIHYWLQQGASAEKIVLGTGFYGRSFTLTNFDTNKPGSPISGPGNAGPYTGQNGMLGFNEICESEIGKEWRVERDEEQRVPYAYQGNQWVGYDDVESITEKAKYASALGLGGAMIWSIETDDFRGSCGEKYPLLKALNNVLRKSRPETIDPSVPTVKPTTSEVTRTSVNPSKSQETTPSYATTNTSIIPTSSTPTTSDNSVQNKVCTKPGYVRDLQDCSKFYVCQKTVTEDFKVAAISCAEGLAFDTNYNVCNFKDQVDC